MLFSSLFFGLDTIGFSGSRFLSGAGCAAGADLAVRSAFEDGRLCLFAVDSGRWGSGRAAFARRSVAIVEAVPSGGLLVVVPGSVSPPPGVVPSRSFHGGGSGSWGSAALALGTGRRVLLWLPAGAVPPVWAGVAWSAVGGWWFGVRSVGQLSMF
jgi:hypothetical protein